MSAVQRLYIGRAAALGGPASLLAIALCISPPSCPLATRFHVPCPGCGLTRASRLLLAGDVSASLHLQPLLVPLVIAMAALGLGVVGATLVQGHPGGLVHSRSGRGVLVFALVVTVATVAVWALRFLGFLGGPVPV